MATTYYCDYENGDDTWDGSTKDYVSGTTGPFQHIPGSGSVEGGSLCETAATNRAGGDFIYLARGSTFLDTQRVAIENKNITGVLTYGAYDRTGETGEADPIVESYYRVATGEWSLVASGVWQATINYVSTSLRLFFNNVGQAKAASSACTAARPWYFASNTLYCYSGSDTVNPTDTYGVVAVQYDEGGTQRSYGLRIVNSNNLLIENIHFRGADQAVFLQYSTATNPMDNITLDSLTVDCCNWGITLGVANDVGQMKDITISSPKVYTDITTEESIYMGALLDGVRVVDGVNGLIITDVDIRDTRHSGINIWKKTGTYAIQNVLVQGGTITGSESEYMRGVDIHGLSSLCIDVTVTGLSIYDTTCRNQIGGENVYFYANLIDTVRNGSLAVSGTGDSHPFAGIQVQATSNTDVINVNVFNNTVLNTFDECIALKDVSSYPIGSVKINNNITRSRLAEWPTGRNYCFLYEENDTTGTLEVNNNVFNTDAQWPVYWDGTFYSVADANTNVASMTGNIEDNPQGNSGDPFLMALSRPAAPSSAYHAGTFIGHYRDFLGRPFHIPPTIGAYEFTRGFMAQTRTVATARNTRLWGYTKWRYPVSWYGRSISPTGGTVLGDGMISMERFRNVYYTGTRQNTNRYP